MAAANWHGQSNRIRRTAIAGLLTALIMLFILLAGLSPTADLALYSLTSLCVMIMTVEYGLRAGLLVYLTAGLLSLAWPGVTMSWPFVIFFGLFPLWRFWVEKKFQAKPAFLIKLTGANLMVWPAAFLFAKPALTFLYEKGGVLLLAGMLIAAQLVYLLYHWGLTLLIQLYWQRFRLNNFRNHSDR